MIPVMDIVYGIMVGSIVMIAYGQGQNYLREKAIKKYFRQNNLKSILVCLDLTMKATWESKIDQEKYGRVEVLSIDSVETAESFMNSKLLQATVRKVGVMRYPCLLTLENNELKGRSIDS